MKELTQIFSQVSKLKVKSVTDNLFKVGLFVFLISAVSAIFIEKDWVLIVLFSLTGLIFLVALFFYCYFALKDPVYLRSETYQLKKQAVELLGDNERSSNPNIKNVPSIMNPYNQNRDNDENPMLE